MSNEIYQVRVAKGDFHHEVILNNIDTAKEVYKANKEVYEGIGKAIIELWQMKFDSRGILITDKRVNI